MSRDETVIETHQCAHTRVPVELDMCVSLTSVVNRNHGGCCQSKCTSEWRLCRECVVVPETERSGGPIDPVSGLCEKHGGVIPEKLDAAVDQIVTGNEVLNIPPDQVAPMPNQPRRHFDPEKLKTLAASIKRKGQISPGLVVRTPNGPLPFQLRDGERRWRACTIAGVDFRAIAQESIDEGVNDALMTSAAANFNREDHTPWEEIDLVRRLVNPCPDTGKRYNVTQIAESLGKHIVWVSQRKIVGERLSTYALEHIKEHTKIPFSIIKQVADLPPEEQLTSLEDYQEGKIKMLAIQNRASENRRAQGLSRNRKPSDVWQSGSDILRTLDTKVERIMEIYSPTMLETTLRSVVLEQGEDLASKLDQISNRLSGMARSIRSVK